MDSKWKEDSLGGSGGGAGMDRKDSKDVSKEEPLGFDACGNKHWSGVVG